MIDLKFDSSDEVFSPKLLQGHRKVSTENKAEQRKLMKKEIAAEILAACGGIPKPGEFYDVLSNGQSNGGGFYEVIRDQWGKVDHLALSTWIINATYIDMLFEDLDNERLGTMTFVISNRMSQLGKGHAPNFNRLKTKAMEHPCVSFKVVNSHAKVYTLTNGIDFITISGSANWSDNPRLENYTISNDKSRYDFHASWMKEITSLKT